MQVAEVSVLSFFLLSNTPHYPPSPTPTPSHGPTPTPSTLFLHTVVCLFVTSWPTDCLIFYWTFALICIAIIIFCSCVFGINNSQEQFWIEKHVLNKQAIAISTTMSNMSLSEVLTFSDSRFICRYRRDEVMTGNPYSGKDRHNGEIAAFHLNRWNMSSEYYFCFPVIFGGICRLTTKSTSSYKIFMSDCLYVCLSVWNQQDPSLTI